MDVLQSLIRRIVPEVKAGKKTKKSKAARMKRSESVDFLNLVTSNPVTSFAPKLNQV